MLALHSFAHTAQALDARISSVNRATVVCVLQADKHADSPKSESAQCCLEALQAD